MAVLSNTIGQRLCDAMGLPKGVRAIQINFEANEPVTALVTLTPELRGVEEVVEIVQRFELVEKAESATCAEPAWMERIDELVALAKAEINEMAAKAMAKMLGSQIGIGFPGVTDAREASKAAAAVRRHMIPNGCAPRFI
jgi:hypothetical protein